MPRSLRAAAGPIDPIEPVDWSHPLNDRLVAWWTGLRGIATPGRVPSLVRGVADMVAAAGSPQLGPLRPGPVLTQSLNGSGDYLVSASTPPADVGPGPFTIEGTAYFTVLPPAVKYPNIAGTLTDDGAVGSGAGIYYTGDTGVISAVVGDRGSNWLVSLQGNPLALGRWYRFVLTHRPASGSSGGMALYTDGVAVATATYSGRTPVASGSRWLVGGHYKNPATYGYFGGHVESVRCWNRALSPAEVVELQREGDHGHPTTLRRITRRSTFLISPTFRPAWITPSPALGTGVF